MQVMTKILFRFNIQSTSDVITNSSSELFVFKNKNSLSEVVDLLNEIYPDWEGEYLIPEQVKTMNDDDLDFYLDWVYGGNDWNAEREGITRETSKQTRVAREFNLDPAEIYANWDVFDPQSDDWRNKYVEFNREKLDLVREKLSENEWALWSKDENPDYEMQEILEKYSRRYHLG